MPLPTIAPNEDTIFTALGNFLTFCCPGIPVIQGQVNRASEPSSNDFIVFWRIRNERIEWNIDTYGDIAFMATIAGTSMTVTSILPNYTTPISVNSWVFGTGVTSGSYVVEQVSGTPGGVGVYTLSASSTISTSTLLAAGLEYLLQPTRVVFQCDVHGPNSGNNAQTISTIARDDYAYEYFQGIGVISTGSVTTQIAPLYADDPRQVPFINAEQQYEDRWIVEFHLQVNQTVTVPQQFAQEIQVGLHPVDLDLPP